jgi:DNA-directed RNA polymerase subunit RPC12/RpoP
MSDTKQIKCARCQRGLEGPAHPQPHDRIACPECGEGDTFECVMAEVGEYMKEKAAMALNKGLRKSTKGSRFLKLTSNFKPKGGHRFVVDVDL